MGGLTSLQGDHFVAAGAELDGGPQALVASCGRTAPLFETVGAPCDGVVLRVHVRRPAALAGNWPSERHFRRDGEDMSAG
ncbi:hypothetical protein GCM10010345_68850 [Streptomyces canarius]|uniref:Uncharacterized protein n=1 Tax=Streptomyces canarius TaxID=285453 RepID=A0ABQ3D2I4_9ACTN|nr:hypothetical protein GCM10010345_68850 [Streptomyces canarius]